MTPTAPAPASTRPCPRCQAPASGKFCASCGAPLEGARCGGCASLLTPGSRFCHRCGLAAGADAPVAGTGGATAGAPGAPGAPGVPTRGGAGAAGANAVPWAVAAIALLAIVALVAGQRFGAARGGALDGSANSLPVPGLDDRGAGAGAVGAAVPGGAPTRASTDISQMAPEERALRLYNRVMELSERGKRDSVVFFAPMAVTAFQMLDSLTLDQRYDLGRVGEISGIPELARAQADTILQRAPTHLLGLILAANVAGMQGQADRQRELLQRFTAARPGELAKGLPEYEAHRADIAAAMSATAANASPRP